MDLRDWLIIIGIVIIVGILIDGYRRMRLAKKDSLQMSRDMGGEIESSPLDEDYNPELPGGGARVIKPGVDSRDPEEQELDFGGGRKEPTMSDDEVITAQVEDATSIEVNETDAPIVADADSRVADSPVTTAHAGSQIGKEEAPAPDTKTEQEVFVINVDCKHADGFTGVELKKLLEACGLDHGDMSIFHRHEEDDLLSPIQFSVANAVEPGYFDPDTLEQLTTPGVSFFMSLPGPKDYMKAFDYMLETAQAFARNLEGELKDEQRSVMTVQTIEHNRQRIRDFERKQLSKSRS